MSLKALTVVVPVYNEIEVLPRFHERVSKVMDALTEFRVELLFVDDGSTDGSYRWLAALARRDSRVRVLRFSRNFGSYVALTAGLANAAGDAAVTISADLQEPPELIPALLEKWKEGYDVVWAARRSRSKDALWRRASSRLFYSIFRKIAFGHYPPEGYDFCLVDRTVIDAVSASQERNTSIFALITWSTFETTSIPYDRDARVAGVSHWNFRKMFRLAMDAIFSFSVVPVRIALWAAIVLAFGLFGYMGYILYGKITGRIDFPMGWPSTMTVILVTSGLQLFVLSILGEYLWRTLDQSRRRPLYVVSRRLGYGARDTDRPESPREAAATRAMLGDGCASPPI